MLERGAAGNDDPPAPAGVDRAGLREQLIDRRRAYGGAALRNRKPVLQ
jgi:hypothetical protein